MSEVESDDTKHDVSISQSEEGQDISPELAVLIAIIVAFVLLVTIMTAYYWLKKIRGEKPPIDFQSDYDSSFQDIGRMHAFKKTSSQVIMITAPGGETYQADSDWDIDIDPDFSFRDFMSVKDVDDSRYKSSQDIASLSTFKSCSHQENKSVSLCSEMSDRSCEQESVNPTPTIKFNFEKKNGGIPSSKDALPSSLGPGNRGSETLELGAEF